MGSRLRHKKNERARTALAEVSQVPYMTCNKCGHVNKREENGIAPQLVDEDFPIGRMGLQA